MSASLPEGAPPRLDTRSVPWTSLRPHPRNPRNGDTEAIAESVEANGVYRPVIVARDGTILAGHHLYYVLGERGGGNVDVVVLPVDPDSPEAMRIMVADNRTADLGRYDDALMAEVLRALAESDDGLLGTAYTDDDFSELEAALRRAEHTPLARSEGGQQLSDRPEERGQSASGSPTDGITQHDFASAADRYATKGIRYVMLEYPTTVYPDVIEKLGEVREAHGLESNAAALLHLLGIPQPAEEAS